MSEKADTSMKTPSPRIFRLSTRLWVSHALLASLLTVAMAVSIHGLQAMTKVLGDLRSEHLGDLDAAGEVHRAAWEVEVALRHGKASCAAGGEAATQAIPVLLGAVKNLDGTLQAWGERVPKALQQAAVGYQVLARRVVEHPGCEALLDAHVEFDRMRLDEDITDAWVNRLLELRASVEEQDDEGRRRGTRATTLGLVAAAVALAAAGAVARSTARQVTAPLAQLTTTARRLGEGDFSPVPEAQHTREVVDLARELERMRVQLLALENLKAGFVASVSHELRTPLSKVREALALLADGTLGPMTERQQRVVTLAQGACEREVRIVASLLDLSRIRSGRPLHREDGCLLSNLVRRAVDDEQPAADEAGVTLAISPSPASAAASLDVALVENALANLIRNAVSVSARGSRVEISCEVSGPASARGAGPASEGGGRWARVRVRDHGPGVSAAARATLFQSFAPHAVEGRRAGGVGLGLAFAREVARAHGGDIQLEDVEGGGACFALLLPLTRLDERPSLAPAAESP